MLIRKFKKLIRNPKLFISDMIINKKNKQESKRIKFGKFNYTVVSAVYNSEVYLDDYFKGFIKQDLDFKNNIQLILVDDGSIDNSSAVIKKWMSKYPNNIKYIYKENGGQASARNVGLNHVTTDWVTFIDSDDFVSPNYFSSIDNLLFENKKLKIVCCNQIYFFEKNNTYINRHPLNYRFKKNKTILPLNDLGRYIQFSAPLAFFHVGSIPNTLRFDETLKPTFEDGKFVAHYILANQSSDICFYETPKYYNRKRSDKSSTMDNAWLNKGQYGVVLENGYIPTLKKYLTELGHIPRFMQRTILWEMLRLVKHLVNQEHNVSFLTNEEKTKFLKLMDDTFSYIDKETILDFELGSCGFSRQVGMLGCFKKMAPDVQVVYIEKYDANKKLLLARYFTCKESLEQFNLDGNDIIPAYKKMTSRRFLSRDFLIENRIWLPIETSTNGILTIKIDDKPTSINYFGKKYKDRVNISDLKKINKGNKELWLFMDRDDSAGDNAEFLYDYCQKNTDIESYFILNKNSHDWNRLEAKGFKLIEYNSSLHRELLNKCSKNISSHVGTLTNPFSDINLNYSKIFLQHGVTKDDISTWINNCDIDLMITATDTEYNEIIKNKSSYIYGIKEIKKTGFPRFDSLLDISQSESKKKILIMPTWRKSISGVFVKNGSSERVLNPYFVETKYAQSISSLLNSQELDELSKKYNFDIIFCPHPNMRPYLNQFQYSKSVKLATENDSIHQLLKESAFLITDYSSVAFDFAYMKKPLCYYQFDEEDFFSGGHTYRKGYYDYRKHGFGRVVNTENSLIHEIENFAKHDFMIMQDGYLSVIDETFNTIDINNCKRTLDSILEMDIIHSGINTDILEQYAHQASIHKSWILATSRWRMLLENGNFQQRDTAILKLIESLRESGKINEAIEEFVFLTENEKSSLPDKYHIELARIHMACNQWHQALKEWEKIKIDIPLNQVLYIKCLSEIKECKKLESYIATLEIGSSNPLSVIVKSYHHMSYGDWNNAIDSIDNDIKSFSENELIDFKPDLILSRCYREIGDLEEAHKKLTNYESYAKDDTQHRYEIAKLAFKTNNWNKVVTQFDKVGIYNCYLPSELNIIYIKSLRLSNKQDDALSVLNNLPSSISETDEFKIEKGELLSYMQQWSLAADIWLQLVGISDLANYRLAKAYRMLGMIEEGTELLLKDGVRTPMNINEWALRAELSQLAGNWKETEYCWSSILRYYPEDAPEDSWNNLYNAQLMNAVSLMEVKGI